ncbi:putative ABC transporter ATP-binding protein [uncultured archaeon]|nr:putative ABC transporter ATP-binding protein [uncultured archaeon]
MNYIAIRVDHLSKSYRIGQPETCKTFRELIASRITFPSHLIAKGGSSARDKCNQIFWALKNVSFEVETGDVVGIIGRNGAGKSTLLKILSRITAPTEGSIDFQGRIGSLLEVGTGFHPELSGRENIYLSGSILGMKRQEIDSKFDDIVKFADIEKFLDTPAKRYSSGMYVRLAFAVAAHLDPEILIIDEVLAVGDAVFQKKCLGKMKDVSKEGRTVLFVSHNMNAIEQLCKSCIILEHGELKRYGGDVRDIIKEYIFGTEDSIRSPEWVNQGCSSDNPWFNLSRFYIGDENGNPVAMPVSSDSEIWLYIEGEILEKDPALTIGYAIYSDDGAILYWSCHTDEMEDNWIKLSKGKNVIKSKLPGRFLNEGTYRLEFIARLHCRQWIFEPGNTSPSIFLTLYGGLSESPYWLTRRPGLLAPIIKYSKVDNK